MKALKLLRNRATLIALAIGVTGLLLILYAWRLPPFGSSVETTENAYVKGQVTLLSPQVAGYVVATEVQDYQRVKKGDVLVRIDDRLYRQQLAQAEATLAQQKTALANFDATLASRAASVDLAGAQRESARAALEVAQKESDRVASLVARGNTSRSAADQAMLALLQARAVLSAAEAQLRIAEEAQNTTLTSHDALTAAVAGAEAAAEAARINLQNTVILAPVDGTLGEVTARVGQYVAAGTQIGSVTPAAHWIIANFKETQMDGMRPGLPATFTVDALGGLRLKGHVVRLSPAAGQEFSVIKPDNATGNFVKITQRMSVRIEIDPGQAEAARLAPGMSVVVSVDTDAAPETHTALQGVQPRV